MLQPKGTVIFWPTIMCLWTGSMTHLKRETRYTRVYLVNYLPFDSTTVSLSLFSPYLGLSDQISVSICSDLDVPSYHHRDIYIINFLPIPWERETKIEPSDNNCNMCECMCLSCRWLLSLGGKFLFKQKTNINRHKHSKEIKRKVI